MKILKRHVSGLLSVGAMALMMSSAQAQITWDFGSSSVFSGGGPTSSGNWLELSLTQNGANSVKFTLSWLVFPTVFSFRRMGCI
jgi:hypothetical protein